MGSISRADALALFAYEEPTLATAAALYGNRFQELAGSHSEVSPLPLPDLEAFAGPVVWALLGSPDVRMVWVDNVDSWTTSIPFATTPLFDTVPSLSSEKQEFVQLAALLNMDGAAGPLESTRFDTLDALLRAEVEMLYGAVMKQAFAWIPKAGGFTSLREHATNASRVVDAGGARLSFELLMCLVQELNKYEGRPEQFTIVLSPTAYRQFVSMMTSAGNNTLEHDPVTGYRHWHFDGIRVVGSAYLAEDGAASQAAWGLIYRCPSAVLPPELQEAVPPSHRLGVTWGTAHRGAVINRHEQDGTADEVQTNVQVTAGVFVPPKTVASLENVWSG